MLNKDGGGDLMYFSLQKGVAYWRGGGGLLEELRYCCVCCTGIYVCIYVMNGSSVE